MLPKQGILSSPLSSKSLLCIPMSFDTDGFRSSSMERFRASLQNIPAYKAWIDFADELNRFALNLLRERDIPRDDRQLLFISVLFVRAHKSFQGALHLAELGLVSDARAVLRTASEGAIALNALANDASFIDRLVEAHYRNQRKLARIVCRTRTIARAIFKRKSRR